MLTTINMLNANNKHSHNRYMKLNDSTGETVKRKAVVKAIDVAYKTTLASN